MLFTGNREITALGCGNGVTLYRKRRNRKKFSNFFLTEHTEDTKDRKS